MTTPAPFTKEQEDELVTLETGIRGIDMTLPEFDDEDEAYVQLAVLAHAEEGL